jgi:hypothetical protein
LTTVEVGFNLPELGWKDRRMGRPESFMSHESRKADRSAPGSGREVSTHLNSEHLSDRH